MYVLCLIPHLVLCLRFHDSGSVLLDLLCVYMLVPTLFDRA